MNTYIIELISKGDTREVAIAEALRLLTLLLESGCDNAFTTGNNHVHLFAQKTP